jgi:hypothetical protein
VIGALSTKEPGGVALKSGGVAPVPAAAPLMKTRAAAPPLLNRPTTCVHVPSGRAPAPELASTVVGPLFPTPKAIESWLGAAESLSRYHPPMLPPS